METHETNTQDPMENTSGDAGAPQDYELANVGARLGAYFIDGFAASIIMYIFIFIAGATELGFLAFVGWLLYITYMLLRDSLPFLNGQSLGKKVLKLRVVDQDTLEPITGKFGKSAVRTLSIFIPIVNIIDIIFIFNADKRHQRMGDQWAKTIVIKDQG